MAAGPPVSSGREFLTVADLLGMPHLGLDLVAGAGGTGNAVLWTHTSELLDPGPWLEGGELLIVNGFGIPASATEQVAYIDRLARHRLAGVAISVRAPELTPELLAAADRAAFPVLRIPRQVPFIELSYLVANASDRSARGRLARHLEIFKTLRLRTTADVDIAAIYAQLEKVSGYRLSLLTPAGRALLTQWPRLPDGVALGPEPPTDLTVIDGGFLVPLLVGNRVTAYLVGQEDPKASPGGLAALQHVSTLAVLDAVDDQRRREAVHREGGQVLRAALDPTADPDTVQARLREHGLADLTSCRVLAIGHHETPQTVELEVRDWLSDRGIPHVRSLEDRLLALVCCDTEDLHALAAELQVRLGASVPPATVQDLPRRRRQALWSLGLASAAPQGSAVFAEEQRGLTQWLTHDVDALQQLADEVLRPLREYDEQSGSELVRSLAVYFSHQGRLRPAAADLFVHEHTLTYRLKRIEQLTGRDLKSYRDSFELWLAIEAAPLLEQG